MGRTPLHWAAEWRHLDVAELLISAGADVNAKTTVSKVFWPTGVIMLSA